MQEVKIKSKTPTNHYKPADNKQGMGKIIDSIHFFFTKFTNNKESLQIKKKK
ncbi:hypothetical protein O9A_00407 [Bartonella koehlerae C-29]|uniref:Uncharacterized protein n=1 Tax=Bartonella koehlerae C-29 TaxID=1134510 RepID=A0A067WJS7_9HYPH|nr:hypothetical protein O9A_00407 [Bartonella koehlerae C-29]